jgi:hypothetical protein
MDQELRPSVGISDEQVDALAPHIRALVTQRLEQVWRACEPHLEHQRNPDTGLILRPDPRFIEAGLRVLDKLARLYRLDARVQEAPEHETDSGVKNAEIAANQLKELEQRMRGHDQTGRESGDLDTGA